MFYAGRYGFLRDEFEMVHRCGLRIKVRAHTDDLMIVKSNFVTRHYFNDFVPIPKDAIVVDVGAHIGAFAVMAAREARKVLAFEPEPSNFRMLKRNVELNHSTNIAIFEMAVCGFGGFQDIHIYDDGSSGSHSLCGGDGAKKTRRVRAVSLDEIVSQEGLGRIDFLKLDCEGAEHEILKEISPDTSAKIMGMAMETHGVASASSIDIPARLRELGFQVKIEHQGGYVYARRTDDGA